MEKMRYRTKMIGVVTLYNPDAQNAAANMKRYIDELDALVVWDNSPLELNCKQQLQELLGDYFSKVIWHGTGSNSFIAPAINFVWHYAQEHGFNLVLIMDQDSQWEHFRYYREEIDDLFCSGNIEVFTPYIQGLDFWTVDQDVVPRRIFINSGTVIPLSILDSIQGADETFALDALDYDLAIRIRKRDYPIVCLTKHVLQHTIGKPKRSSLLKLYTPDYGAARTYSIVSSHILNYRKNRRWMNGYERRKVLKEFLFWKLVRILFAEDEKWSRLRNYLKGIKDGVLFDLSKTKP